MFEINAPKDKFGCIKCGKDSEDNGWGLWEERMCNDCLVKMWKELNGHLGLNLAMEAGGILLEWDQVDALLTKIHHDPTIRATVIMTDIEYAEAGHNV